MLLIGTMNWASTRARGVFNCPECGGSQQYRHRTSRPFLTLYFIPILPIGGIQEYVECTECRSSFEPVILDAKYSSPLERDSESGGAEESTMEVASFESDMRTAIALMMVEDGHVTESEIVVARRVYENIVERNISREELGHACSEVRLQQLNSVSFLATAAARRNLSERIQLVQATFAVASVEGELSPGRLNSLKRMKSILKLDEAEFQEAIEEATQWL
ncbi:MAG: zinc-ribbon domain-containing protein [Pirellulaceae bacterium]